MSFIGRAGLRKDQISTPVPRFSQPRVLATDSLDNLFVGWLQEDDNRIQLRVVQSLDLLRSDVQ